MALSAMQEKAYKCFVIALLASEIPRSNSMQFFLWGFVKDKMFVPRLPQDLQELKQRITNVLNALTGDLLSRVWQELDYSVDIWRVARGAHIKHL
ncbi:hypothetical protein AVEN_91742-1 [Araneus ventricosus]|uniref:Uncharacterized protein n=1 Tax=Araneus ventricosus TaxID=182803 RepID=A0A4Y2SST2_ARAVE|nr:hypothetical protein AVEN_91742-1 [Araneus ventricosus]